MKGVRLEVHRVVLLVVNLNLDFLRFSTVLLVSRVRVADFLFHRVYFLWDPVRVVAHHSLRGTVVLCPLRFPFNISSDAQISLPLSVPISDLLCWGSGLRHLTSLANGGTDYLLSDP